MNKLLPLSMLLLSAGSLYAQQVHQPTAYETVSVNRETSLPSFITFSSAGNDRPDAAHPELWFRKEWKANDDFQLKEQARTKDIAGNSHVRYAQLYKGIPVDGAIVNLHFQNGIPAALNGVFYPDLKIAATIALQQQEALHNALAAFPGAVFAWQVPAQEAFLKKITKGRKTTYYPDAALAILPLGGGAQPLTFRYAYRFDIYTVSPLAHKMVYVDAVNGTILDMRELINDIGKTGVAHTKYSGKQSILADSTEDGVFILEETSRGNGIGTYDATKLFDATPAVDNFEDDDNDWNNINPKKDEIATDIHWALEQTYDFYSSKLGRNSVDDAGHELIGLAHVDLPKFGLSPANAFWNGTAAYFGDGDDTTCTPMTSLDIIGHEISHGLTQFTAGLSYMGESGALNESFSDIMGKSIEHHVIPAMATWEMGKQVMVGGKPALRSMKDPNSKMHPKYYNGLYYYTGVDDNGGVHTNSGVQNFWFYLLCEGGSGTRESDGAPYLVKPIGWDKALQVAYANLSAYLTSASRYTDAAAGAIAAAKSIYGASSDEAYQVQMAWYAVGLAAKPAPGVAIAEVSAAESFKIAPNPANSLVQLTPVVPFAQATIKLVNMTGQVMLSQSGISGAVWTLDMSAYAAGMYIVEISDQGHTGHKKLSRL